MTGLETDLPWGWRLQISLCWWGAEPSTRGSAECSPLLLCCDRWTLTSEPALGRKDLALPAGAEKESKENPCPLSMPEALRLA